MEYFKKFWKYKGLLNELVIRDIKTKYRRSFLGYAWSILNPLLMMMVVTTVFSYMFRFNIENYPIYLLTGQLIYNFFSESTSFAMSSILSNSSLIKKVYVPKYIFPLAKVISSFVNLIFALTAIFIVIIFTGTKIKITMLLIPIPLLYTLLFCIGIGLIMSVSVVYFRDMMHLYSVFLTILMYITPIFYPIEQLPTFALNIVKLNPLYYIVEMLRKLVIYGQVPTLSENIICLSFGVCSLILGLIIFKNNQDNIILYI